ncbi:MAG: helix-turn-helix domain-containing protein [Candidatus Izemoplasmataceae bacterium]
MYELKDIMMMFNIPERTIRRHLKLGLLKGSKVGGIWRFTEEDIMTYTKLDSMKQTINKQTLHLIIDTYNGVKGSDLVIIIPIKKTTKIKLAALSLEVSTFKHPFTFDLKLEGSKHIITFKGDNSDAVTLINYVENHFEKA